MYCDTNVRKKCVLSKRRSEVVKLWMRTGSSRRLVSESTGEKPEVVKSGDGLKFL